LSENSKYAQMPDSKAATEVALVTMLAPAVNRFDDVNRALIHSFISLLQQMSNAFAVTYD